jgi:class 3 adenylate cyclase
MRSGTVVLADDAAANTRFARDPYVLARSTRSALCVPIKNKGIVTGVVYLENDSLPGAFTAARAELVTLLAGQIAISIENALLYASLEQRVADRTQQLVARNAFIREVFGRYMSDEVVDTLLESKAALRLGGERRVLTVMLTDLRGFTALCERLSPEQAVRTLNNYLAEMTAIIQRNGGNINSFIGDGIMVLFGAPIWRDDHVDRALVCALEMQRAMVTVNAINLGEGLPELWVGIGLHTGEVVVGNFGSSTHAKYSAIGRHVNLSSRVESAAAGGEIFISDATREAASLPLLIEGERQIRPKGLDRAIMVYSLVGVDGREDLRLADRVGKRRSLVEARSLAVHQLDDKELSSTATSRSSPGAKQKICSGQ